MHERRERLRRLEEIDEDLADIENHRRWNSIMSPETKLELLFKHAELQRQIIGAWRPDAPLVKLHYPCGDQFFYDLHHATQSLSEWWVLGKNQVNPEQTRDSTNKWGNLDSE